MKFRCEDDDEETKEPLNSEPIKRAKRSIAAKDYSSDEEEYDDEDEEEEG